jgi:predicted AlkP superfamily pyrophosphatase or phosphodiesterase
VLTRTVAVLAALLVFSSAPAERLRAQDIRPKLVVFIVIDQMRADYPVRYAGLLEHGLKRLMTGGASFRNAAYPYFNTLTCVGHSTIGTGTLPFRHGMINNAWYDRATDKAVSCNADPGTTEVSYATSQGPGDSAYRMMTPTLAETMRSTQKSRVATMSMKSRSAIGLAGHEGDFVTWFGDRAAWETSSAFAKAPLAWFLAYAKANPVSNDGDKVWERTLPADRYQYDDDAAEERPAAGWGPKFPHPLGPSGDAAFFQHWLQSPYPDAYLEHMAETAVDAMHLGTEDRTDFLGVSFSMLDTVGHAFGPRSHEVQDVIARLDATIGHLLDFLDKKVGADKYVLALSADHGVADMPEQASNGGRISIGAVRGLIEASVKQSLGGDGPFVAATKGSDVYFKAGVFDRLKDKRGALKAVMDAAASVPGVTRVLSSVEIGTPAARTSKDGLVKAMALSYFPDRSGDIFIVPKENWLLVAAGTTHGSAYGYDQRVPLVLYGAGIQPGSYDDAVTPADLAPTVASIVGVTLPSPDGHVLSAALKKR